MEFSEFRDYLDRECDFPIEHETLIDRIGDADLEAPSKGEESVETVLDRTGEDTYRSAEAVYNTLVGNVGDAYVGRKYYDDRGGVHDADLERSS